MTLANVFSINKKNFELNKDNILGKLDNPKEGDFVENLKDSDHGYRMSGVYNKKR
jgi:hypothetical protein